MPKCARPAPNSTAARSGSPCVPSNVAACIKREPQIHHHARGDRSADRQPVEAPGPFVLAHRPCLVGEVVEPDRQDRVVTALAPAELDHLGRELGPDLRVEFFERPEQHVDVCLAVGFADLDEAPPGIEQEVADLRVVVAGPAARLCDQVWSATPCRPRTRSGRTSRGSPSAAPSLVRSRPRRTPNGRPWAKGVGQALSNRRRDDGCRALRSSSCGPARRRSERRRSSRRRPVPRLEPASGRPASAGSGRVVALPHLEGRLRTTSSSPAAMPS